MSSPSRRDIRIAAGTHAYEVIRDGGLSWNDIRIYFGPAVGPRWLIAAGFDRTLIRSGHLGRVKPLLLLGASAGAWRLATWVQPEAEKSYSALIESYISAHYTSQDTPETIQTSLLKIIDSAIEDDALPFALKHPRYRLAIITSRSRHITASSSKWLQGLGFGLCFLFNALSPQGIFLFIDRVVFYSGPLPPLCERGYCVPLATANFKPALLASGAIPLVVAGVRNIYGAPKGTYRDGGLTDYQLNSTTPPHGCTGLSLCFLHQAQIIPRWLDKRLARPPEAERLANTIIVRPSEELIAQLPGGKVPDRDDITRYLTDPETRMKNWRESVDKCAHLGEVFIELVESHQIAQRVERIPGDGTPV